MSVQPSDPQIDELFRDAKRETKSLMDSLVAESKRAKDAEARYQYNGETHAYMRAGIREAVAAAMFSMSAINTLIKRVKALESKVTELRDSRSKFRGVHQRAEVYRRGDLVTRQGSMWSCVCEKTTAVPGLSDDWQLAVKRGTLDE